MYKSYVHESSTHESQMYDSYGLRVRLACAAAASVPDHVMHTSSAYCTALSAAADLASVLNAKLQHSHMTFGSMATRSPATWLAPNATVQHDKHADGCLGKLPCREYNRADNNSRRNRDREERDRLRAMEREDRDRRRLEAMHAKRYPIDDLDLIAEQRHRSSYSSGSSSMPAVLLPSILF